MPCRLLSYSSEMQGDILTMCISCACFGSYYKLGQNQKKFIIGSSQDLNCAKTLYR